MMQCTFVISNVIIMQDHLCGFWKLRYHGVGRTLFMYVQHSVRPTPCSHCSNSSNNL